MVKDRVRGRGIGWIGGMSEEEYGRRRKMWVEVVRKGKEKLGEMEGGKKELGYKEENL